MDKYLNINYSTSSLIITAPHGGGYKPNSIPDRIYGRSVRDTYTKSITEKILKYVHAHSMIALIHRSKVDLNRDKEEAAQGNKQAIEIWTEWNKTLSYFRDYCVWKFGYGLYVDIHAHNDNNEFHLGYDLDKQDYLKVQNNYFHPLYDKLFGKGSFKYTLENLGYLIHTPNPNETYYNGGRNIEEYGKGKIFGIQIEIPVTIGKNTTKTAKDLARAISIFKNSFAF